MILKASAKIVLPLSFLMFWFCEHANAEVIEGFASDRHGRKLISLGIELQANSADRIFGEIAGLKKKSYIYVLVGTQCDDGGIVVLSRLHARLLPNLVDNGRIDERLSVGGRMILEEGKKHDGPTTLAVVRAGPNGRPPRKIQGEVIACGPMVTAID